MKWFLVLLLIYAFLFMIVVWPMHWMWHTFTRKGSYDPRFYRQRSYWRLYAFVFGTAVIIMWVVGYLWRRW
jgi:hypothetical protein